MSIKVKNKIKKKDDIDNRITLEAKHNQMIKLFDKTKLESKDKNN